MVHGRRRGRKEKVTYCYHYYFGVHLALSSIRGSKHVPFYYGDDEEERYYVGCFPAVEAVGHALKDELGDEWEWHIESREERLRKGRGKTRWVGGGEGLASTKLRSSWLAGDLVRGVYTSRLLKIHEPYVSQSHVRYLD